MNRGWIKLHRKIGESSFSSTPNFLATWIHLLIKASHENKTFFFNGIPIELKPGQFITGRNKLEKEIGIPHTTLDRILDTFVKSGKIGQQKTNKYRLITILKWKTYQEVGIKRASNGHNQEVKEVKEDIIAKAMRENLPVKKKKVYNYVPVDDDCNEGSFSPRGKFKIKKTSEFLWDKEIEKMKTSPIKVHQTIVLYWLIKKWKFENWEQFDSAMKRELRPAKALNGYTLTEVRKAIAYCRKKFEDNWTLETIGKWIPEALKTNSM